MCQLCLGGISLSLCSAISRLTFSSSGGRMVAAVSDITSRCDNVQGKRRSCFFLGQGNFSQKTPSPIRASLSEIRSHAYP